ncbi:MAG: DUF2029 domain-containing protein [Candidatus Omnitrophica bacterium]|nr:DUF2029 domain-containing protein [Candidatus Omnitrophota bacterium]
MCFIISHFQKSNTAKILSLLKKTSKKTGGGLCGLFLGVWLFKPQFPCILILFFLFSQSYWVIAGFLFVTAIYYRLGASVGGLNWPVLFYKGSNWFIEPNLNLDKHQMINILGILKASESWFRLETLQTVLYGIAIILSLGGFAWLGFLFWQAGRINDSGEKNEKLGHLLCLSGPALLLISPHALFYDF